MPVCKGYKLFSEAGYICRRKSSGRLSILEVEENTRAVQKDTELFFLIYCCTYNLIRLVSFKVLPSTVDTPLPAFFLVLERVLERVLRDGAKVL